MNQEEFGQFINFKMPELYRVCQGMSGDQVMALKRDLQKAITAYSKGKGGSFDRVQEKAVAIMMKLEKWVRLAFMEKEMKFIERNYPNLTKFGRKSMARQAWEAYNKKMSY